MTAALTEAQELKRIRWARGKFAAMAGAYSIGCLNDNLFKQAALLLALGLSAQAARAGDGELAAYLSNLQGYATIAYTLPFLLFAAYAGWLADRFSKRRIVITAKVLEVAAMLFGGVGLLTANWGLVLVMIFMMGLQATIFSPALNGSIPELYPPRYVTRANSLMKVFSTVAILLGVAGGSLVMELASPAHWRVPLNVLAAAGLSVIMSILGLLVSLGVPKRPAADPGVAFPRLGPVQTLIELGRTLRDPLLAVTIFIDSFVWFVGSLLVLLINALGIKELQLGEGRTGLVVVAELCGIAVGGLVAGRIAVGTRWYRFVPPAAMVMGVVLALVPAVTQLPGRWQFGLLVTLLGLAGLCGGLILIPMESFIQIRPDARRKGTVIAAANFAAFTGIMLSGPQFNAFAAAGSLPSLAIGVTGMVTLGVGLILVPVLLWWRQP